MGNEVNKLNKTHDIYGEIPASWEVFPLIELCMPDDGIQTGPFGSLLHKKDYVSIGTPIITVQHLGDNRILHEELPCVTKQDKERLKKFILKENDIVFSRVGSVDCRALVRRDEDGWLFSGRCIRVRPNPQRVDSHYLSWFFGYWNFKEYIRKIAFGATMPSLNTKLMSEVPILVPPMDEQIRIASILDVLEAKENNNRKMNETLEAMARAIFKAWFVDFEPVKAKLKGEAYPLPDEVMVLFPDELVESELGLIPQGWRVKPIEDVVSIYGGGTPSTKKSKFWENGEFNFVTPKDLSNIRSPILLESGRKVSKAGLERISSGLLPKGTVLMSSRAPVGYLAIVEIPVCINQGFIAMVCDKGVSNYYILNWAMENIAEIKSRASGTTFPEISKRNFRPMPIVVPLTDVINKSVEQVEPLYQKIVANLKESRSLVALRDALLSCLMNGKLRVKGLAD